MSVGWADRVEAAIDPYESLDELIQDLKGRRHTEEASKAAAAALECLKELLEE
jgi:hypothetical protein